MAIASLFLAVFALFCCVYLWLELQKKLSSEDIGTKLSLASEELSKAYAKQLREIEAEWADMYQKFSRLAGRVDKNRGLEAAPNTQNPAPGPVLTGSRSDLIRKHRGGANR
jgi:hypothetical protein